MAGVTDAVLAYPAEGSRLVVVDLRNPAAEQQIVVVGLHIAVVVRNTVVVHIAAVAHIAAWGSRIHMIAGEAP